MAAISLPIWPSADYPATEDRWEAMVSEWFYDGVVVTQNYNGEPTTGLLRPFGDSSGMVTKISDGAALIRGFHIPSEDLELMEHDPADTLPRWDRTVLRLTTGGDSAEAELDIVKGAPGASTVIPSLTNTDTVRELPICRTYVPGGAITIRAQDVFDERFFAQPKVTDPVGTVKQFYGAQAPAGHLAMNGQTVSTATYPVLAKLWGISAGTMVIPDMTGMVARGLVSSVGATGGANDVTLSTSNMPAHSHGFSGTWSGGNHGHQFYPTPHSHGVSDPGHAHGVNDPGHSHSVASGDFGNRIVVTAPSSLRLATGSTPGAGNEVSWTSLNPNGTGVSIQGATTGVSVQAASGNGVVDWSGNLSGSVSGSVASAGSGTSFSIIPSHRQLLFIIKAH